MVNVLWLASWYPNRMDASDGDFIERHALAVSKFAAITLLLVIKDGALKNNAVQIEKTVEQNLTVYKVYYGRSGWGGPLEQLFSFRKYIALQKQMYQRIVADTGPPAIVHIQVAMKAGMLGCWLLKKYQIPFIVTEHWTGYYPQSHPNIYNANPLFKILNKKILKNAALFLPVADALGKTVNQHFVAVPYKVIPNTVNTGFFFYQPAVTEKFRFIHPSYLGYQKNPEGILAACKMVKEKGYDFELQMIGNRNEALVAVTHQHEIHETVVLEAAVSYPEVAKRMQQSSALLLFSRFENLPCVVLEALCCGLPVISSRVGGIAEVISSENGILVESEDIPALAGAMMQMIDTYRVYNRSAISAKATALYNYDAIGSQYAGVYKYISGR
ncbi:MAG: glycosyltransferase [Ferruginibacter sp.]|nr:glycosyltransferase [Ferruginibacter sp.]